MSAPLEIDARRLMCPLPVIRLQDCINLQTPGTEVSITCTDPGTQNDIPAWCRINGHEIIDTRQQQFEYVFLVRKGGNAN
jgi:TusA-related sulfurtransferase